MNSTIWLALALVLVLEGLGPMLYPAHGKKWFRHWRNCRKMFYVVWRRTCGCGRCGLLHVEENDWLSKKWSDLPQIECKKCCISEKSDGRIHF
ncbi:Uncharacterized protein conserved in bacteria (DUF2065) [Salmonella enterica]|nr:Uncharacterized protein conserved in bacteria (DUF2065) [Salmonella enterica]